MTNAETTVERVGAYRVVRKLATGGTSDVLLAKAEGPHGFERTVVLKLLLSELGNNPQLAQMFVREASAYARLSHGSIVRLFDFFAIPKTGGPSPDGGRGGQLCMVLEHIDGPPLSRLRSMLKAVGHELDDKAAMYIACRIFDALAAAHAATDDAGESAPVIHRDVNPSNVLLPWDGQVKLADFGVAKVAGLNHQSVTGMIKGTYGYMAPEQVTSDVVSPRADVYAAAIILWELLTKRRAFQRGALPEVEALRAMAEPRLATLDVLRPDLDRSLREAVKRALEARVDRRTITAEEMVAVLGASVSMEAGREQLVSALSAVRNNPQAATSIPPIPSPSMTPRPEAATVPRPIAPPLPKKPSGTLALKPLPRPAPPPLPSSSSMVAAKPGGPPDPLQRQTASARLAVAMVDKSLAAKELPNLSESAEGTELTGQTAPTVPRQGSSAELALRDAIDEVLRGQPSSMPPSVLQSDRPESTKIMVPPPSPPVKVGAGTLVMERVAAPVGPSGPPPIPEGFSSTVQEIVDRAEAPTVAPPSALPPQTERMAGSPLNKTLAMEAHRDDAPTAPPPTPAHPLPAAAFSSSPPLALAEESRAEVPVPSIPPRPSALRTVAVALILLLGVSAGVVGLVAYGRYRKTLQNDHVSVRPTASLTASTTPLPSSASAPVPVASLPASTSAAPVASGSPPTSASVPPSASVSALPPASAAVPSASVAPSASVIASAAPPSTDIAEGMGIVKTAGAAPGRRIFVDEKVLGQTPESVTIKCGPHTVRLGSSGKPQRVEVPCRGELTVSDRF